MAGYIEYDCESCGESYSTLFELEDTEARLCSFCVENELKKVKPPNRKAWEADTPARRITKYQEF